MIPKHSQSKGQNPWFEQLFIPVAAALLVALVAGTSAPWWFPHFFPKKHVVTVQMSTYEDDGAGQLSVNGVGVHVCIDSGALVGIDADNNRFLCTHSIFVEQSVLDTSNRMEFELGADPSHLTATLVHVCPAGTVMVGWHQGFDWLICGHPNPPLPSSGNQYKPDGPLSPTQVAEPNFPGTTLHACGVANGQSVVVGIDAAANTLICEAVT
jgi:hypothetical protein